MLQTKKAFSSSISRRNFIKSASAAIALTAIPGRLFFFREKTRRNKMILSFYMDDTNPYTVKAESYRDFLGYCQSNGIKGESSVILGYDNKLMTRNPDANQRLFLELAGQSYLKGIDSHLEIMTHSELFNFKTGQKNDNGIHEGLWLHEPAVTSAGYQDYFSGILGEAEKAGFRFTGLTWPGCSCNACTRRYAELRSSGPLHFNQGVFEALITLAKKGRFRNRVLPVFYESSETEFAIFQRAAEGKFGVYDLQPNAEDHFGIWENSTEHVNPDYYLSEDGKSGIILRHLENNSPYCMWYMHWQGVNPGNGVGWEAFKTVTARIRKHLNDQVVWMRPSEIVTCYHDAGSWGFADKI